MDYTPIFARLGILSTMVAEIAIKLFALVDSIVELYLSTVVKPFLSLHEKFYSAFNAVLRKLLDDNRSKIADWFTANFITYVRTVMVIPTLLFLAWGHRILPSFIVILVDFADFLDGVVARYWVDIKKEREKEDTGKDKCASRPTSPTSDDDSFGECVVSFFCASHLRHLASEPRLMRFLLHIIFPLTRDCNYRVPPGAYLVAGVPLESHLWRIRRCCM